MKISVKNNKTKRIFGKQIVPWLLICPLIIVLYLAVWRPTVIGAFWSFFKMNAYNPGRFVGLENYKLVISNSQFFLILCNTMMYVFWSLVIGFIPPLAIAIMINEMVHLKSQMRVVMYLPAVIPGIAAMLIWARMYDPSSSGLLNMLLARFGIDAFGWLDNPKFTIIGIVLYMTWSGFAGTMLLYYATVQGISSELYEAALIDGAGPLRRCWHVTLPQMSGILLLNLVRQIIGVFQVMEQPLAMTDGGPNGASASLSYQLYLYGFKSSGQRTGQAMALGVIIFLILLVLTCFYFWLNRKVENNF
ncbi:MAG: sugar ABC transporter permease [Clostridia bacterium]|nr:sugar ABC transporter permease [Clostridia bacterium]